MLDQRSQFVLGQIAHQVQHCRESGCRASVRRLRQEASESVQPLSVEAQLFGQLGDPPRTRQALATLPPGHCLLADAEGLSEFRLAKPARFAPYTQRVLKTHAGKSARAGRSELRQEGEFTLEKCDYTPLLGHPARGEH